MNTEHFKQKLEKELKTLNAQIKDNERIPGQEDESATESDEVADKIEDMEEEEEENTTLTARRADVEAALEKIANGTYGICEVCGGPIEEERLEADPAAKTCSKCM
ncbi:MAG TPA: TraR/DksA C4-type zinc finger protein [Candidatus Paceibacterota bacterium]|nr:TraR/DksA C4-type zinc finger protein [Candidatus Paceibacterota bacterium]